MRMSDADADADATAELLGHSPHAVQQIQAERMRASTLAAVAGGFAACVWWGEASQLGGRGELTNHPSMQW